MYMLHTVTLSGNNESFRWAQVWNHFTLSEYISEKKMQKGTEVSASETGNSNLHSQTISWIQYMFACQLIGV